MEGTSVSDDVRFQEICGPNSYGTQDDIQLRPMAMNTTILVNRTHILIDSGESMGYVRLYSRRHIGQSPVFRFTQPKATKVAVSLRNDAL